MQTGPSPSQAQWLHKALAHHHDPDPEVENQILVLATGIDQYLQEVFHHLAYSYSNRDDVVSAEDFTVLCAVLGLTREGGEEEAERDAPETDEEGDESHGVCVGLPRELPFRDFHSRLCGYFRVRAFQNGTLRLPVTAETEHVERQIRVRWPRVRRRKCVSFDLRREHSGRRRAMHASQHMKCQGDGSREKGSTQQPESEAASLRELVEDLRCALQGSDARCLALEVALRRGRGHGAPLGQANEPSGKTLSHSSLNTSSSSHGAAPEAQRGAAPEAQRGAAPEAQRGAAPEAQRGAAPEAQRGAAPEAQRGAAPEAQRGAAPEAQRGAAPEAQRGAAPEAQRGAAPEAQRGAAPEAQRGAAPEAQRGAAPEAQRGAAPEAQRGAVGTSKPPSRGSGVGGEGMHARRASHKWDPQDLLLRELKLIRSSRDGQVEEAIRFNRRLEEELSWAYQEARRLGEVESRLRKENAEIRRRAEEAREALRLGLQRVRLIQEQARKVPTLQSRIAQLESQLQEYRSDCTCRDSPLGPRPPHSAEQEPCLRTSEGLQRAVEGKASSDEEEEEKAGEGQCCLTEVKKLINRLHSTAKGCPNPTLHHFLLSHHLLHDNDLVTSPRDGKGRGRKGLCPAEERGHELQKQRSEEAGGLRPEVQVGEPERVRLSLLEEKLTAALTLLLKLRKKNVSRRALGQILLDALDKYRGSDQGPSQVLQVADALCARLSRELTGEGGGGGGGGGGGEEGGGGGRGGGGRSGPSGEVRGHSSSSVSQQSSAVNPLLISC